MPLIHNSRKALNSTDIQTLQEMLHGNLQSIVTGLTNLGKLSGPNSAPDFDPAIKVFQKGLEELPDKFKAAQKSKKNQTATEFIQEMYDKLAEKVVATLNPDGDGYDDLNSFLATQMGGTVFSTKLLNYPPDERDTEAGYHDSADGLELADKPMEGIGDIAEYKPESGRVLALYEGRAGNSNTLREEWIQEKEREVERHKDDFDKQAYNKALEDLEAAKKAPFGLHAAAEYARIRSSEMMAKDEIGLADVWETFSNLNRMARPNDPEGGTLRGQGITAGELKGPNVMAVPQQTYQTMQTIAEHMNTIKQTQDPALRKTRAIQLAAYAYQMTLSQHVFSDGNGRTCRMFADSILQTFGLPPHTPSKEETEIIKTIGTGKMDFNKGAEVFLKGVQKSDLELKKDPEIAKQRLISKQAEKKQPEKKQSGKEKNRLRLSAIYEVSDDTVDLLGDLKQQAAHAKGKFRDSQEYKNFLGAVNQSHLLAKEIQQKRDTAGFDLKKAEAAYAASIRKLFKTASDYTDYKLKDHTENRQQEPEKKKLNDKDREKLNLMKNLTENKLLTKEKEAPAAKEPQIGAIK